MSDQNQNPPADNTNQTNTNTNSGGSLLNRFGSKPTNAPTNTNNNAQNNQQNGQNNPPSSTPFGAGRFGSGSSNTGSRFGSGASNNNNASNTNNNAPAPSPSPFRSLPSREQIEYALLPLHKVAVRFELKGLGDPFYRLLGHEVNTEHSDSRLVVRKLEQGGDDANAIRTLMDSVWEKYGLKGALMVYTMENENLVKQLNAPSFMPKKDLFDDDDDNDKKEEPPKPAVKVLRAIDIMLVLNVLARARTQVLLATSPVMFNQHYLNRAIVSDDPRLVALAMATGVI